jgi:hypothetical protein
MLLFLGCLLQQTYPDEAHEGGEEGEKRGTIKVIDLGEGGDGSSELELYESDDESPEEDYSDYGKEASSESKSWAFFSFDKGEHKVSKHGHINDVSSTFFLRKEAIRGVGRSFESRKIVSRLSFH